MEIRQGYSTAEVVEPLEASESRVIVRKNIVSVYNELKDINFWTYEEYVYTIPEYIQILMNEEDYVSITGLIENLSNKVDSLETRIIALENA